MGAKAARSSGHNRKDFFIGRQFYAGNGELPNRAPSSTPNQNCYDTFRRRSSKLALAKPLGRLKSLWGYPRAT